MSSWIRIRAFSRSVFTTLAVGVVLAGGARAAAAQVVLADLNGDGICDRIEAVGAGGELVVHTSNRRHPQRLRLPDRLERIVVGDINRDGRADIIATTRRSGLVVWINSGRGRFRSSAPPRAPAPDLRSSRNAGNSPASSTSGEDVDAALMGLLPLSRPPIALEAVLRRIVSTPPSARTHRVRPRVPRGPPSRSLA
jgi:hypothetical protein